MREGDLEAGLFCGIVGGLLILILLGLERAALYAWRRMRESPSDDPDPPAG